MTFTLTVEEWTAKKPETVYAIAWDGTADHADHIVAWLSENTSAYSYVNRKGLKAGGIFSGAYFISETVFFVSDGDDYGENVTMNDYIVCYPDGRVRVVKSEDASLLYNVT